MISVHAERPIFTVVPIWGPAVERPMFPQIMLRAATLAFFAAAAVTPSMAKPQDGKHPTRASLAVIAQWVSTNLELPMIKDMPRVELVPSPELARLGNKGLSSFYDGGKPAAVYDDATRTIYLPESWTGNSPAEMSVLVHEVAHDMQNQAGIKYACEDARAEPAYLAQDKWLQTYGLTLKQEFRIDMFAIEVMASCL
jgi:hypothetical protein